MNILENRKRAPKTGVNFKPRFPSQEPTREEIAWVAGFMEGEGSFNGSLRSFEVSAYQSDKQPLIRLKEIMGGEIYTVKPRSNGKVNSKESFTWRATGRVALVTAMYIYEFLSDKRKNQIHEKLQKLANQGWQPS